ncbi:MAG: hypothetical protein WB711_09585 [Terriglobales bacterium]
MLLNLVWLTLALPAIWMWRHESVCPADGCRLHRIRPFLLFSCVLVLLFPVISATDDLHAMRQEMEESSPSKRMVKQGVGDRSVAGLSVAGALPAWISPVSFSPDDEPRGVISGISVVLPRQAHSTQRASRAPPLSPVGGCVRFAA